MALHPSPPAPIMRITKVELKNIKNHTQAEFSFQPGVIAICGPNGAGKTTILEAIAWALFDHLDYKRDDFVKRGAKKGQVTVGFISDRDEREYLVTRDTGGGYQVYDPITKTRLIEQKNQVVPWLQQQLGVEPATDLAVLFKTTIGVPQGAFTYDFTLPAAQRKNVFDRILKVEEYRAASDNLRDTLRHIETRITEADRKLAEAEGELKAYDETKRQHDETAARVAALTSEGAQAASARERAAQAVAQLDDLQRGIETQRAALERWRVKLDLNSGSLVTAREAAEAARAAAAIVMAARAGYENYLTANARLSELERQRIRRDELRQRAAISERQLIEARSQTKLYQDRLNEAAAARIELASLSDQIAAQTAQEERIALLREGRGESQSLERSLSSLAHEVEKLRQRYSALNKQVEAAAALGAQAELAPTLEAERSRLDEEINRQELARASYELQRQHLATLQKDCARLAGELDQNERELTRLRTLVSTAARLSAVETEQQTATERLAQLRAEVARDEEMITGLEQGGFCPLLTEKCLNLKPGESLDGRFRAGLQTRRGEIATLQSSLFTLAEELKGARRAAAEIARLPHLQSEVARLTDALAVQQTQLAPLEASLAQSASLNPRALLQLKEQRHTLLKQLDHARAAERLCHQAEVLRGEMELVKKEGAAKNQQQAALKGRRAELGDIEAQISQAEISLRALGDPRGRAAALGQIVKRAAEWQRHHAQAEQQAVTVNDELAQIQQQLRDFAALDMELSHVQKARTDSERAYQSFIANEKLAATVAAREQEAATLTAEIAQTEKALAHTRAELAQLEQQYDAEQHRRAQIELDAWRARATQLATQLEHAREQFVRLATQLAHLEAVRERLREHLAARERAQTVRGVADFIRDILQKAAPFITESYLFSISNEANHLYREISGRYDVMLQWTKDYEITLEEDGRARPFLNLSGGEQMAAALAVRLALLKELSEVNLAFFDEPTTNMDEERRRNLAQQLGRIKDFHQLFVISHDDSFEGYTDQIINLAAKADQSANGAPEGMFG